MFGLLKKNSIKYNLINATRDDIKVLEKDSSLTYISNPLDDKVIKKFLKFLQKNTGLSKSEVDIYTFTGKDFNELYNVSAYDDGDKLLCFKLENWEDINKLAYNRGFGRWLDDIVDNLKDVSRDE